MSAAALPFTADAEVDATPQDEDERYWSVTTIIKAIGSDDGLIHWSAQETARAAINKTATWQAIQADSGDDEAVKWLADQRYAARKGERTATRLGSAAHRAFELYVVDGKRPPAGTDLGTDLGTVDDELEPYLDSFEMFLNRFQPEYVAAEAVVYHPGYGYAGTADGFVVIQGTPAILDYKSAKQSFDGRGNRKKPWADVGLQLAAYRHAEFAAVWRARKFERYGRRYYALNAEEKALGVPVPATEGGLVLHVTPHHADLYSVQCGPDIFECFLYAIEAARWSYEIAKTVIGKPIALMDRSTS